MATAKRPVQTVILQNYTLDLKMLGENNRFLTETTLATVGSTGEGATRIFVSQTSGTKAFQVAAGTSLTFRATGSATRQQVLILADVTIPSSGSTELTIAPLLDPIPAGSNSRLIEDMFPLLGITSFGLQPSPTVVDTTHSQSGSGTSSAIVRTKREISIEGIEYVGDIALEQFVKRTYFDPAFMNRELYAIATYPNGTRFEGPSKITALNLTGTPMEVMKYTFTLEFQDEVLWTPGYYSSGGAANGFPAYNPN